ncbi:MAG: hypothetical protein HY329_11280 [Chloroflexi bacterium]|nr:hypothetical protein [Chloroflexota bacterium]
MWQYSAEGAVTANSAAGSPAHRYLQSGAWDRQGNRLLIFGGRSGSGAELNDLWQYTTAGGWQQLLADGAEGSPSRRRSASAVWDTQSNRLLVFGGRAGSDLTNDLWQFVDATGWSVVTANWAGSLPRPRSAHDMAWDSSKGRLLLFGGITSESYPMREEPDFWAYTREYGWQQVHSPQVSSSRRYNHSATWDSEAGRLLILGGSFAFSTNDLLEYTDMGGWRSLTNEVSGTKPSPREGHAAAFETQWGGGCWSTVGSSCRRVP